MKRKVEANVCDFEDDELAVASISWKESTGAPTLVNDVCQWHLDVMTKNSHKPTRGRKPKA